MFFSKDIERINHEKFWKETVMVDYDKDLHKIRASTVNKFALGTVCEIGCGEGGMANYLFIAGHEVTAIDFSSSAISRAKKRYGSLPIRFEVRDAKKLPYGKNEFDTATLLEILEHTTRPEKILAEAHRVAKKRIIVTVPNRFVFPSDPLHVTDFDKDILKEMLSPYVKKVFFEKMETNPLDLWLFAWGEVRK